MNRERIIGLAVILAIVGGFFLLRGRGVNQLSDELVNGDGMTSEEEMSEFAKQMGAVLPDDVERAELDDVSGGESSGLATRKYEGGLFEHSVLAALPDPAAGSWYEGWLVRSDPFDVIYTGKLSVSKGGFMVNFERSEDLLDHNEVVVTLEKVDDQKPEAHVLEGSF